MLKRLILVLSFVPAVLFLGLRWIVTGKDAVEALDRFIEWAVS